ncbi:MAG: DUF3995 domain-containing protein [Saprospiraceae bacterium]|nr:DUF3995 domain-containing protein [Saprospiraceae bacterium]
MNIVISIILCFVFIFLASFHFYWAFGGKKGTENVIPVDTNNVKIINPSIISTLFVGIILLLFAFINIIKTKIINIELPEVIENYCLWFIAILFLLRAIGEFNYIGFFKKIKTTKFGIMDTKVYSPLCLFIGISEILIELTSK